MRIASAGAAAPALAGGARAAVAEAAIEPEPKDQLGEEGDHAGDDDGDDHHAHVAVADMGEFVAENRFDLGIVEPVEQPGRDRDRVLLLVHARWRRR